MKKTKRKWAKLKFRKKIRNVLVIYYLTPILLILLASGGFFYYSTKKSLDEELGLRLESIAFSAASQVRGFHIAALGSKSQTILTRQTLLKKFETLRKTNKVAKIYLFNENDESLLDTDPKISVGSIYQRNRFNRAELDQTTGGNPTASILFRGEDGQYYKSAFAPIIENGKPIAFVGVDGSATFFRSLHLLGRRLAYFTLACIAIVVLVSLIISRKIVTPIQLLVQNAQRIGEGHLDEPIQVTSKNEIGFLGFALDEMRKNIIARDRELKVLFRGIAHEVRNPLGGMELFAGILEEEAREPKFKDAVSRIQHEIKTLKTLVEEFLDFARGPSLQFSKVELQPFLEDLKISFQREFNSRSINFLMHLNGTKQAEFDPDQMRRAFLNLIQNSLQAMPKGGELKISTNSKNGSLEITVEDSGDGIEEKYLDKLFDPFFTTKEKGTGLGLSFVRKIVNAHAGEVRVKSKRGQGTSITIVLPR